MANHLLMGWERPHAMPLSAVQLILVCAIFTSPFDTGLRLVLRQKVTGLTSKLWVYSDVLRGSFLLERPLWKWRWVRSTGGMTLTAHEKTQVLGGKPLPVPLAPPRMSHSLVQALTWVAAVICRLTHVTACWRQDLIKIIHKYSTPTSQRTQNFSFIKHNPLIKFRKIHNCCTLWE